MYKKLINIEILGDKKSYKTKFVMVEQSLKGIIFRESARRRGDTDRCDTEHVLPSLSVFALASPNPPPRREA